MQQGLFECLYAKVCDVQRRTDLISPDNLSCCFVLDRVRRLGELPMTLCHGDLTLENMMVGPDGTIWFVDLLDSPFEHYWQDVAKMTSGPVRRLVPAPAAPSGAMRA